MKTTQEAVQDLRDSLENLGRVSWREFGGWRGILARVAIVGVLSSGAAYLLGW